MPSKLIFMKRLKLLGSFDARVADTPLEILKSPKGCALVAYLLIEGGEQPREAVADLLWDASSSTKALRALRVLLTRVRKSIPEISASRMALLLEPTDELWVDLKELIRGLESGNPEMLDDCLQLYCGDLLSPFYLRDAPRFNDWLTLEREHLKARVLDAYQQLCMVYQRQQQWELGSNAARRWLQVDHLSEEAHRAQLTFLAAAGQPTAALQHYDRYREHLWQEFEIQPDRITQAIANQIAQLESLKPPPIISTAVSWNGTILPDPIGPPPHSLVPYHRNADFVGRDAELQELGRRLLPNTNRDLISPVALCGIGGVGKTQLAVEFAFRFGRFFPGGVYWISFADADDIAQQIAMIGGEGGLRLYQEIEQLSLSERTSRVRQALRQPIARLLIFDNCTHVDLLTQWLPISGGCSVLITSRRQVWPRELQIRTLPLMSLQRQDSVQFLTRLAPSLSKISAEQIAAAVGDLPLALHLAGSYISRHSHLTAKEYAQQLLTMQLHHPALRGRGAGYSPTKHILHMEQTIGANWAQLVQTNKLDQLAQQLLIQLACFAPGEPIASSLLLATITANHTDPHAQAEAADALNRLIELGLIDYKDKESVAAHRLITAFVLDIADNVIDAQRKVENILIQVLIEHKELQFDLYFLPVASGHLLHITLSALKRADANAAQLADLLGTHLLEISEYEKAAFYLEQALQIKEVHCGATSASYARTLYNVARLNYRLGQWDAAFDDAKQVIDILEEQDHPNVDTLADSLGFYGFVASRRGHLDVAKRTFERALTILNQQAEPNKQIFAETLREIGRLMMLQGEYASALVYHQRALTLLESLYGVNNYRTVGVLHDLGANYGHLGHLGKARNCFKRTLAIIRDRLGMDSLETTHPLRNLGVTEWRKGNILAAKQYFEQALRIDKKHLPPDHPHLAISLNHVGESLIYFGEYEQAKLCHERAYAICCEKLGNQHVITWRTLSLLGEVMLRTGDYKGARSQLERAWTEQKRYEKDLQALTDTALLLGETYVEMELLDSAKPLFEQAVTAREETFGGENAETAYALFRLGTWHQATGDSTKADECYQRAARILSEQVDKCHPYLRFVQQQLAMR